MFTWKSVSCVELIFVEGVRLRSKCFVACGSQRRNRPAPPSSASSFCAFMYLSQCLSGPGVHPARLPQPLPGPFQKPPWPCGVHISPQGSREDQGHGDRGGQGPCGWESVRGPVCVAPSVWPRSPGHEGWAVTTLAGTPSLWLMQYRALAPPWGPQGGKNNRPACLRHTKVRFHKTGSVPAWCQREQAQAQLGRGRSQPSAQPPRRGPEFCTAQVAMAPVVETGPEFSATPSRELPVAAAVKGQTWRLRASAFLPWLSLAPSPCQAPVCEDGGRMLVGMAGKAQPCGQGQGWGQVDSHQQGPPSPASSFSPVQWDLGLLCSPSACGGLDASCAMAPDAGQARGSHF